MARPKGTPKINRVTISLDDQTHRVLQAYSDRDDVSISWLIRQAIVNMIDQSGEGQSKTQMQADRITT